MAIVLAVKVVSDVVTDVIKVDDTKLIFGDVENGNGVYYPDGYIAAPGGTSIGDTNNNGTFATPAPPTPPALTASELEAYKLDINSKIDSLEKIYRSTIFEGDIDGFRAYELIISLLEMADVLTDATYPKITGASRELLAKKASKRSTTETAEATDISNTYINFRAIIGETAGIRTKHKDVNNDDVATTDKAGCDAVLVAYISEMDAYILALP